MFCLSVDVRTVGRSVTPNVSQLNEVWEKVRLNFRLITTHKSTKQTLKFA